MRHKIYPSSRIPAFKESANASCLPSTARHKMSIQENLMQSKFGFRELNQNEKSDLQSHHQVKRPALTGRKFKELFKLQATKAKTTDNLLGIEDKLFQGDGHVTKANNSSEDGKVIAEKPNSSCEGQSPCRMVCKRKPHCSTDETPRFHDIEKEIPAVFSLNSTSAQDHHAPSAASSQGFGIEGEQKKCVTCSHGGQLLCCAGQGCSRSFHLSCVKPPFTYAPPGVWHCIWCIKRKIEMGVYAVSEGIESVLDVVAEVSDDEGKKKQKKYLVKYKGLAHIHNRWVPRKTLALESPAIFSRNKQKNKKVIWKREWSVPQRLLAKRSLVFPDQSDSTSHGNNNCHYEWLVKWTGCGYDHATWELENASFLSTSEALKLINDFEIRHKKADHFEEDKRREIAISELPELPFGCQEHLNHVNKLRGYWYRYQNALVIDDQERVVRVVLFVFSLLQEMRGPFLILTTLNALSMWEAEFSRWGSHANFVVYKGSRNVRSIIRNFEFYNENGDIMFQVLLSCCADIAEDIENFKTMDWEVIVLDECQRPTVFVHFDQIKLLAANMKLLLLSSQIKDWNFNYHGVLCLLDPEYDGTEQGIIDANPSSNDCKLKERLVPFIAYECQSDTIKFMEFWVPAMLTNVQIEQYCACLFSKSTLLCSSLRCDSTGSLHDILVSTRQCCDHPFLVDWSLRSVVLKGIPAADHFDVEIQLSGKLQLLNKILSEIERRGLRVVIFFQSLGGSGTISVGDILDDFVHQKFGKDTYIRIDGNISRPKKQAACDMFNSKYGGKFVCLIEARACIPSTKLSSVDTIVIFNSDWDPLNDIKALQKISITSKLEQMNILRLYSSCTVEEKILILAKEGLILDSNIKNIKRSFCHKLLTWGASCLFRKLDVSTEFNASSLNTISTSEQTLLEDVFQELLHLLPPGIGECSSKDYVAKSNSSNILSVQQNEGTYRGRFSLHGELMVQSMDNFSIVRHLIDTEPPHIFWTNLLKGKQPRWKYMSSRSQRIKRKFKYLDDLPDETEYEEEAAKKARTQANSIGNCPEKTDFMTKRTQNLATTRYGPPIICALKATGDARVYDRNVQQHCKAVNLSIPVTSTDNNCPGGGIDSEAKCCSLPDQSPRLGNSTSTGETAVDVSISVSRGIQNDHTNSTGSFSCKDQALLDTSMQGLACLSISSLQQSIQNLAPQPSVTSIDRSEPNAASLGHQNKVPYYPSNHPTETFSGTSPFTDSTSLQKLIENMQEGEDLAVKLHNDLKLRLESERDKEIEEINKKYDVLICNAENAMAKTKTYLETCYSIVHKHKLLADAILQLQKHNHNHLSAPGPQGKCKGQPPEEPQTQRGKDLSTLQPAALGDPAFPEQDLTRLHAANSPAATSVQVMQESSDAPKSSARTSAGENQSSSDLGSISSFRTSSEPMHTSNPRAPSIPTTRLPRNIHSGCQLRAPAPHLRHTRPSSAVSALGLNSSPASSLHSQSSPILP